MNKWMDKHCRRKRWIFQSTNSNVEYSSPQILTIFLQDPS